MQKYMYNAIPVDLNDYVRSGEGANGESYNHKVDPDVMVKIYSSAMDTSLVKQELDIARKVYDAGIPSPEPGEFVVDQDGRYGIKFRRLVGKISYARAIGNNPEDAPKYARMFASMCRKLHSTHLPVSEFPSVKQQYLTMLEENTFWTEEQKEFIKKVIVNTPDTDTAVHGDLQFGNLLLVGDESYFIDLGEFAVGHPYFDLAMTMICGAYNEEDFTQAVFHMSTATARVFWEAFVDEYFEGTLTPEQAEDILFPYIIVKCLLIERNMGASCDRFHKYFFEKYGF